MVNLSSTVSLIVTQWASLDLKHSVALFLYAYTLYLSLGRYKDQYCVSSVA